MNAVKIVRILATVLAIAAAFVSIPYAALGLAVLGAINGVMGVPAERRTVYMATAVALAMSVNALDMVPAIGSYLTAIFTNFSTAISAGVLAVFVMVVKERLTTDP